MKITFLGTGSMMPTKERNTPSILLSYENENILVDCGEGTQRQLRIAGISPTKITKILITHWHGDHVLGLPGLLQTIASQTKDKSIEFYGPKNTRIFFKNMLNMFVVQDRIDIKIKEINKNGSFYKNRLFSLEAIKLDHLAPCLGYSFIENNKRKINLDYVKKFGLTKHPLIGKLQEGKNIIYKGKTISVKKATYLKKGKKITFILDTKYCNNAIKLSKNSDLLIAEATFLDSLKDKAHDFKHLTTKEAALIAKKSNSKKLILTHFSQRHVNNLEIEKEARSIFKETITAKDFLQINI